jgi:hypothetical protein
MKMKSPADIVEKKLSKNKPITQDEAVTALASRANSITNDLKKKKPKKARSMHASFNKQAAKVERKEGAKELI